MEVVMSIKKILSLALFIITGISVLSLMVLCTNKSTTSMSRAKDFIKVKRYRDAIPILDSIIYTDITNPEAYFLLGLVYLHLGETYKTNRHFNSCLILDSTYNDTISFAYFNIGNHFISRDDENSITRGLSYFMKARDLNQKLKDSITQILHIRGIEISNTFLNESNILLSNALSLDTNLIYNDTFFYSLKIKTERDLYNKYKGCSELISLFPRSKYKPEAIFLIGKYKLDNNDYEQASMYFNNIIDSFSTSIYKDSSNNKIKYILDQQKQVNTIREFLKGNWRLSSASWEGTMNFNLRKNNKFDGKIEYHKNLRTGKSMIQPIKDIRNGSFSVCFRRITFEVYDKGSTIRNSTFNGKINISEGTMQGTRDFQNGTFWLAEKIN